MKTRFNQLTIILSLSVFTLILFSCEKDDICLDPVTDTRDNSDFTEIPDFEEDFDSIQKAKLLNAPFAKVMASIEFEIEPHWDVSIKSFTCRNKTKTLLVYNAHHPNLELYNSDRFLVLWFRDGKPIKGTNRVECVCGGKHAVIVINRLSMQGIGIAYFTGASCSIERIEDKVRIPTTSDK